MINADGAHAHIFRAELAGNTEKSCSIYLCSTDNSHDSTMDPAYGDGKR